MGVSSIAKYSYTTTGAEASQEAYTAGDDDYRDGRTNYRLAQTFTPSTAHTLTKIKIKVFRVGLPGTTTLQIQAVDGANKPTGAALSSGTFNSDTITTDSGGEWVTITMSSYALAASTMYAMVLFNTAWATASKQTNWRQKAVGAYAGGQVNQSTDGGSTWTQFGNDFMFEEFGTTSSTATSCSPSSIGVGNKRAMEAV